MLAQEEVDLRLQIKNNQDDFLRVTPIHSDSRCPKVAIVHKVSKMILDDMRR